MLRPAQDIGILIRTKEGGWGSYQLGSEGGARVGF